MELTSAGQSTLLCMPRAGKFPAYPPKAIREAAGAESTTSTRMNEPVNVNVDATASSTPDDPGRYNTRGAAAGGAGLGAAAAAVAAPLHERSMSKRSPVEQLMPQEYVDAERADVRGADGRGTGARSTCVAGGGCRAVLRLNAALPR